MAKYQHIDLNYLNDLSLGSKYFREDLIISFIKTTPDSIAKMQDCIGKQDWQQIGGIAHKLKTSFSFMGMEKMVKVSAVLQDLGLNNKELEKIPALIDEVVKEYPLAEAELKAELSELK
jgi:HPt (histidine-containing phosphotransfer) domain-containing protein